MDKKWWHEAVVYEIYCRSFCDSDGDGICDLRGVISRLPVLKELGINCIWFAPIYPSPQVDKGYDVSDYKNIEPAYGTLGDFKELLDLAHSMGIRVIMDMVLNHSSDEHFWFRESRKSKDNPYRDYYIWKEGKEDGSEPNNWGSYFREGNGSAWEFDQTTGEYYFHQYAIKMPDLNWECRALREEIYEMLNWWLDLGVDGFRLDVISRLKKTPDFPDTKKEPDPDLDRNGFVIDTSMCTNVEGIHEILQEMHERVFSRPDCMTVGEGAGIRSDNAEAYVLPQRHELDMVYHFELAHRTKVGLPNERFRDVQKKWWSVLEKGGWAVQYLSNHDSARQVSAYGDDGVYRTRSAKLLATLTHTTPGTPFVYQGEEIGMVNVEYGCIEDHDCRYTLGDYYARVENGQDPAEAIKIVERASRDNARTPYQWNDSENAGFSTGKPWLKVNPRYSEINLEKDLSSPDSVFRYYQRLIALRKEHPAMVEGDLTFYLEEDDDVLVYTRACRKETLLVIANKSGKTSQILLPAHLVKQEGKLVLGNVENSMPLSEKMTLAPWEVGVYTV